MVEWKKQIRRLIYDFVLPSELYQKIIKATEHDVKSKAIPPHYRGPLAENDYKYDVAYNKLLPYIRNI